MLEIRLSAAREAGNTFMEDQIAQMKAGELSQSGPPDLRMLFARQEPFESLINFLEAGGER
jgi:hypothetical protein